MLCKCKSGYLCRSSKVKFFPIKVFSMAQYFMIRQGICDEVDIVSHQSAGENMTMFPLIRSEELERIGTKLQSTTQIRNQPILQRGLGHWKAPGRRVQRAPVLTLPAIPDTPGLSASVVITTPYAFNQR